MSELAWLESLKPGVSNFLKLLKSQERPGYYNYSLSGDLLDNSVHWNVGSSVFAIKLYYTIGQGFNDDVRDAANYIKSFRRNNGLIYDPYVLRKGFLRNLALSFMKHYFFNPLVHSKNYIRAETRQCYSALMLYDLLPTIERLAIIKLPMSYAYIDKYLKKLDWRYPWGAGSHFSHLLFYLNLAQKMGLIEESMAEEYKTYAIDWVSKLQNPQNGSWYANNPTSQQIINGAMKIITGLVAAERVQFKYADKLIDLALSLANTAHACDNFNIIYVLGHASKLLNKQYRQKEIEQFAWARLKIYKSYYYPDVGGFSFYPKRANDKYYGARITKALPEPDIHGTVMFMWGISVISQILGLENKLGFREFSP